MTYIFLVAGKGTRLHPLTFSYPKSLYKLDDKTTVLHRMVKLIKKYDKDAEIVLVTGFMKEKIKEEIKDVLYIDNPFYRMTNSISSLWFAREYLDRDNVTIINGDTVMSEAAVKNVLCATTDKPLALLDSSVKKDGDYNAQVQGDKLVVMSKELDEYFGEFVGVMKFDRRSASDLRRVLEQMIDEEQFDEWYEDVLVRMIFRNNYNIYYKDMCDYAWTEVDNVNDLMLAKKIHAETELT